MTASVPPVEVHTAELTRPVVQIPSYSVPQPDGIRAEGFPSRVQPPSSTVATGGVKLVITDLDDTLWQWCTTWHEMFHGFNSVLRSHNVPEEHIEELWAQTYARRNGETIEFPPEHQDLRDFTDLDPNSVYSVWREASAHSRYRRDAAFRLFPTVRETLGQLSRRGVTVVAHTDSPVSAAEYRIHQAGLDGMFHSLYARPVFDQFGDAPPLTNTVPFRVDGWKSKPSTTVLDAILRTHNITDPSQVLYVGDSMRRDMRMADTAGCHGVWASYGTDYLERERAIATLVKVQRLCPFPPDASMANEPNRNGHTRIGTFSDVLALI